MAIVSMKQLLEAGVHFGHQTRRWNPKMAPYIYTERNGIYIIDLQKTVKKLEEAYSFVRELAANGESRAVRGHQEAGSGQPSRKKPSAPAQFYVNARWLGGMLTNFTHHADAGLTGWTQLRKMEEDGTFDHAPQEGSHQAARLEIEKLEKYLGGVKEMKKLPWRSVHCRPPEGTQRHCGSPEAGHSRLWPLWIPTAIPMKLTT